MTNDEPSSNLARPSRSIDLPSIPLAISATILLLTPAACLPDGRIGVLYVGCIARSPPFWEMRSDPLFSISFVQATLRDWGAWGPIQQAESEPQVHRMVRLYMPRSYRDMTSRFDVIVLANANTEAVGIQNIEMLAKGVREGTMGLLMSGGWETFGGAFGRPPWGDNAVGKLLPTEDMGNIWVEFPQGALYLVIDRNDHELISSIPWEREKPPFMTNFQHNLVRVREGGQLLAHVESMGFKDHPAMVTWELDNKNRVFALTSEIHAMSMFGSSWTYYLDYGSNLMIYLNRRPVPQDIDLVHAVRARMYELGIRRSLLVSLLEFCDSFGANTATIIGKIDGVDELASEARPAYLQLRFEETLEAYERALEMLQDIEKDAVELKNRTLLWVYVIEWLSITGTAMICGFALWSLMIRRSLYREVRTTKLEAYKEQL